MLLAVGVLATSAPSDASSAHGFPQARWVPSTVRSVDGCAQARAFPPVWLAKSGHGGEKASVSAKACPSFRGGLAVDELIQ